MKKSMISLSLLASFLAAAPTQATESLDMLLSDAKTLNTQAMDSLKELNSDKAALKSYAAKVDDFEAKVAIFAENQADAFSSKDLAVTTLDQLEELSTQATVLAKTVAYLSSHQADNASSDYQATITTTSKTILRLSDDIGTMSDRILKMADKIGVMADRIVKTQEIQSANLQATEKLTHYAMTLASTQTSASRTTLMTKSNISMHTATRSPSQTMHTASHSQPQNMQTGMNK